MSTDKFEMQRDLGRAIGDAVASQRDTLDMASGSASTPLSSEQLRVSITTFLILMTPQARRQLADAIMIEHNKPNGGPAYPSARDDGWGQHADVRGMSLRDWYKGQALAAMSPDMLLSVGRMFRPEDAVTCAATAGMIADALIAEGRK